MSTGKGNIIMEHKWHAIGRDVTAVTGEYRTTSRIKRKRSR